MNIWITNRWPSKYSKSVKLLTLLMLSVFLAKSTSLRSSSTPTSFSFTRSSRHRRNCTWSWSSPPAVNSSTTSWSTRRLMKWQPAHSSSKLYRALSTLLSCVSYTETWSLKTYFLTTIKESNSSILASRTLTSRESCSRRRVVVPAMQLQRWSLVNATKALE